MLIKLRGHQCEECKNTQWLRQSINLEVHHINGDKNDNTLNNLKLLCPNCHSYTENYNTQKDIKPKVPDEEFIMALQSFTSIRQALIYLNLSDSNENYKRARKLIEENNITLIKKPRIDQNNIVRKFEITREELKKLIRTKPFTHIANQFNVSDTAIRKRCKFYGLPTRSTEIKKYSDDEWERI